MSERAQTITIPRFDDLAIATGRSADELEHELRLVLAAKLYELHRVSLGIAAEIAGLSKQGFVDELGHLKVPVIDYDPADLAGESNAQ